MLKEYEKIQQDYQKLQTDYQAEQDIQKNFASVSSEKNNFTSVTGEEMLVYDIQKDDRLKSLADSIDKVREFSMIVYDTIAKNLEMYLKKWSRAT